MGHQGARSVFQTDWRLLAFLTSAGAASIHLGAARPHLAEYLPTGIFMLVSGVAQLVWAIWIARGAPRAIVAAGLVGNAAIICLWAVSRTTGLPIGMDPWMAEHIHGTDLLCTALEFMLLIAAWGIWSGDVKGPHGAEVLFVLASTVAVVLVQSHEPAREHLTAAATLSLALAAKIIVEVARSPIEERSDRRDHEKIWFGSRRSSIRRTGAHPGSVTGGWSGIS